jgi:hypothetical protein
VLSFASEISELRSLGFAESLPIEAIDHARGIVVRLESGRRGVAVELCAGDGAPSYVIRPLLRANSIPSMATNMWSDVLRDIHQRPPLGDDE